MKKRLLAAVVAVGLSHASLAATPPGEQCDVKVSAVASERGNPAFRGAAQKGLSFLARESRSWTQANPNCYGCHVQSVALEGLSIGKHNRYDVAPADLKLLSAAMLNNNQGVHATTFTTARAFGGVAFARYDQLVDAALTEDLLKVGRRLIQDQNADGSVKVDDVRFPIESGVMQATFQAMQTWRQAYARTADDVWLTPLRKAEEYIQVQAQKWVEKPDASAKVLRPPMSGEPPLKPGEVPLQDLNYALMGLTAAGVGSGEPVSLKVQRLLLARQLRDGGWGFRADAADAFATGQTVYALRTAGYSEKDRVVSRGMGWLAEHQQKEGGWGGVVSTSGNSRSGEAMWAVMGLVTVDVMSVALGGIVDGQHVEPSMALKATARDNAGGGVKKLELFVDDLPAKTACGDSLDFTWDTASLTTGKHLVDVVATNGKGETARRRYEVYAGNVFLTQVGSRFDPARQVTELTFRDVVPEALNKHQLSFEILSVELKDGSPVPGKTVFSTERAGATGAQTMTWDGKGADGKAQPRGRYFAQVSLKDAAGKVLQSERVLVFHEREEVQKAKFAEVEGTLAMGGGALSANTEVELVDEQGKVVQRTTSTAQGNYRFKNVDPGKNKVRARTEGFKAEESRIEAKPAAAPVRADFSLSR